MSDIQKTVTAYKGFDKNFKCRGFQYEVGKEYKHEGSVELCSSGFHACTNPFDVWSYYDVSDSKFALVELVNPVKNHDTDSKVASANIHIKVELTLPEFIKTAIDYVIDACKLEIDSIKNHDGDSARIGSSGGFAQIGSSGGYARIGSSGGYAQIGSSGDYAQIGSSGDSARIGSSGGYAQIGSSGGYARIGSSGDFARIGSSGGYARIGSSGGYARIGSSGDSARIGSSGDSARIGSSGDYARIGSSGDSARIGSSGDSARIDAEGIKAIIASAGLGASFLGKEGTAFALPYFDKDKQARFVCGVIGENNVKPDTLYRIDSDGNLKEEKIA